MASIPNPGCGMCVCAGVVCEEYQSGGPIAQSKQSSGQSKKTIFLGHNDRKKIGSLMHFGRDIVEELEKSPETQLNL